MRDHPMNQPFFDSVPLPSVVAFATLWPMSLALCVQFFIGRHVDAGRTFTAGQVVARIIVIGVLASIGTAVLPLPATLPGGLSGSTAVVGIGYAVELVAVTAVAVPALITQWRRQRSTDPVLPAHSNLLICRYALAYLAVMAILWASALPEYLSVTGGVTSAGDPIGSLWYALVCFVVAGLCLAAAVSATPRQQAPWGRDLTTAAS